jgi:Raf kinase inhibitor-like YbhB/YbcL family protein
MLYRAFNYPSTDKQKQDWAKLRIRALANRQETPKSMTLVISSSAFASNEAIPQIYTCEGANLSPPLEWSGIPAETSSIVLIVDDPDAPDPAAPKMTWVHWLLYNLPPTILCLPEGMSGPQLPTGTLEGLNNWRRTGYGGPCPPIGKHRYFFKLYAMSAMLPDLGIPSKDQLERSMNGKVLAMAELVGTYEKQA